jgi:hypothetical protein
VSRARGKEAEYPLWSLADEQFRGRGTPGQNPRKPFGLGRRRRLAAYAIRLAGHRPRDRNDRSALKAAERLLCISIATISGLLVPFPRFRLIFRDTNWMLENKAPIGECQARKSAVNKTLVSETQPSQIDSKLTRSLNDLTLQLVLCRSVVSLPQSLVLFPDELR